MVLNYWKLELRPFRCKRTFYFLKRLYPNCLLTNCNVKLGMFLVCRGISLVARSAACSLTSLCKQKANHSEFHQEKSRGPSKNAMAPIRMVPEKTNRAVVQYPGGLFGNPGHVSSASRLPVPCPAFRTPLPAIRAAPHCLGTRRWLS